MLQPSPPKLALLCLLLLCGLLMGLSLGLPQSVSQAGWSEVTSAPLVEQCAFLSGQSEFSFVIQNNGTWQGSRLTRQTATLQAHKIHFSGDSLAELGKFLTESPCGISRLAGTTILELRGQVRVGETFDLILPSNPATGYLWEIEGLESNAPLMSGQSQMRQISPYLGGIAVQTIPIRALRSSTTTIRLRYHRPWETDTPVDVAYSVQGEQIFLAEIAQQISLSIPDAVLGNGYSEHFAPLQSTPSPDQITAAQDLPVAFNWCSSGKCTPVRDQGSCGSCWAFATVGVLESKLLIANNNAQDLSEQYLLSCNTDGWDCNGGWFAHDYHIWKIPPSETEAGAVLENAFPYQAASVPCSGPYNHPYRALSWSYINRYVDIPSVNEIKQAIYTYGPVQPLFAPV